jgi:DMSO/TMAO reductase YedYZ molybdopterin-dependent catalytic subunit
MFSCTAEGSQACGCHVSRRPQATNAKTGYRVITFFECSLTLDQAAAAGALLACAMNGAPLPRQHGYPLRLVVPGWYGMASVKWLTEIAVIDHSFHGHFQDRKVSLRMVARRAGRRRAGAPAAGARHHR